jgi:hypothetical protein
MLGGYLNLEKLVTFASVLDGCRPMGLNCWSLGIASPMSGNNALRNLRVIEPLAVTCLLVDSLKN